MQKKQPSTRGRAGDQYNISKRSMDAVPRWALAVCAVLLVLSFAIRQIGLDITTPLNRIMSAYAVRIENRADRPECDISDVEKKMLEALKKIVERLKKVEALAHRPVRK